MRRKIASQDGAAMVEFALFLIPLMIITFGIIEVGLMVYNSQVITNASREGARAGIVGTDPRFPANGIDCYLDGRTERSIECVVKNYCKEHLFTLSTPIDPTIPLPIGYAEHAAFDSTLTVEVNYTYSFLVLSNLIPGINNNVRAETSMKYQ
jgi:hypothetical protein